MWDFFYFPWHRHQIEGTNGFLCLIRKTQRFTISNVESQVFTLNNSRLLARHNQMQRTFGLLNVIGRFQHRQIVQISLRFPSGRRLVSGFSRLVNLCSPGDPRVTKIGCFGRQVLIISRNRIRSLSYEISAVGNVASRCNAGRSLRPRYCHDHR